MYWEGACFQGGEAIGRGQIVLSLESCEGKVDGVRY